MISIQNGKVIFTKYNIEIDEEKLLKPKKGEAASDSKYMIKLAIENAGKTDKKKLIERVDDREESKDYSSSAKEKAVSRVWSDMVKLAIENAGKTDKKKLIRTSAASTCSGVKQDSITLISQLFIVHAFSSSKIPSFLSALRYPAGVAVKSINL